MESVEESRLKAVGVHVTRLARQAKLITKTRGNGRIGEDEKSREVGLPACNKSEGKEGGGVAYGEQQNRRDTNNKEKDTSFWQKDKKSDLALDRCQRRLQLFQLVDAVWGPCGWFLVVRTHE